MVFIPLRSILFAIYLFIIFNPAEFAGLSYGKATLGQGVTAQEVFYWWPVDV